MNLKFSINSICFLLVFFLYISNIHAQTVSFSNADTLAPSNEACVNDTISFHYTNFSLPPNRVQLKGNRGDTLNVIFSVSNSTMLGINNYQGVVTFVVPNNATSGTVTFVDSLNSVIHITPNLLVIHNPMIDFLIPNAPICADNETVLLYAFPSGGIFIADTITTDTGFIQQDTINATLARWPIHHYRDSMQVDITYSYTAQYTNNRACPNTTDTTKSITIYDNRLDRIEFAPLTRSAANASNILLSLDTSGGSIITDLSHGIFCDTATSCYPHSFSGTWVTSNNYFIGMLADTTNTIRLEFNNNGCIGSAEGVLTIIDTIIRPQIVGLVDTLCRGASSILLERDSVLAYSQYHTGDSLTGRIVTNNILASITTFDTTHQIAISNNNITIGQESYLFDPSLLPLGTTTVIISMEYLSSNTPRSNFGSPIHIDTLLVTDTITIVAPPSNTNVAVINLNNTYCQNDSLTPLELSHQYLGIANNMVSIISPFSPLDTIFLPNDTLNPAYLYDTLTAKGVTTPFNLILNYKIDYHGCIVRASINSFSIADPLSPHIADTVYCSNADTTRLVHSAISLGITEHFNIYPNPLTVNPIIDSIVGLFNPQLAALDSNLVVYTQSYTFNGKLCSYTDTGIIHIAPAPQVELTLDALVQDTFYYCANNDSVLLGTLVQLGTGTGFYNALYTRAGVIDTVFYPNTIFAGMGGDTSILLTVTDSLSCIGEDSVTVIVHNTPTVRIDSAFNFIASPYGINDTSDHTYIRTTAPFTIDGFPSYTTGLLGTQINGFGIFQASNNIYYYAPNLVPLSAEVDTIWYTYTDSMSCTNQDYTVIKLDSIASFTADAILFNQTAGVPNLYEACINDSLVFDYDQFAQHPDKIQLRDTAGNNIDIFVTAISTFSNGNNSVGGTIVFSVPPTAATSAISFWNGSTLLYTTTQPLIVHNPILDFLAQTTPLCADNTNISLYGVPSGGFFTADSSQIDSTFNFITNTSINATHAKWPATHIGQLNVDITYNYLPQYSNGNNCSDTLYLSKALTFYDNRLHQISFATIVKQTNGNNNRLLTLDSINNTFINFTRPSILCNNTNLSICYPHIFSGTYVNNNQFLGNLARVDTANPIRLEFNNNGCRGIINGNIFVTDFSEIYDLPNIICRQTINNYVVQRDPSLVYAAPIILPNGNTVVGNQLVTLTTQDTALQNIIAPNNSIAGSEDFIFYPSRISPNDTFIVFTAKYNSYEIDTRNDTTITQTIEILDTVFIVEQPFPSLTGLSANYCANDSIATFQLSPYFLNSSSALSIQGLSTTFLDTLVDTIFNPRDLYNTTVPSRNQDVSLQLNYNADYYGCIIATTGRFSIIKPLDPVFVVDSTYCKNRAPLSLITIPLPNIRNAHFVPFLGLDSAGNFNPSIADTGRLLITYVLTDNFGCTYSTTNTTIVSTPPSIDLLLDSSSLNATFCTNESSKLISYVADSSLIFNGYTGQGVVNNNRFDPSSAFGGGSGTTRIIASVANQAGCLGADTLTVTILPPPVVNIESSFNNQVSLDTLGNQIANHTYCKNTSTFTLNPIPSPLTSSNNNLLGNGIIFDSLTNNYTYNPRQAYTTHTIDTVIYTYTNIVGCTNSDTAIINIDTIPVVSINGSTDTSFCLNNSSTSFLVIPSNNLGGTSTYSGFGISPTGEFNPRLAGIGAYQVYYQFTDANNCTNRDTISITVKPLPTPLFTGYNSQYCISAPDDTLYSLNNTTTGQFSFYGSIVLDSTGILRPSADTSNINTGIKTIYYSYTDSVGCTDTISENIFIHPNPTILISGLDSAYCYNGAQDNINLEPQGGTFISQNSNVFSINGGFLTLTPNQATSAGYQSFKYRYTDRNGCIDTILARTYIHIPQQATITGLDSLYCQIKDTIRLTGNPSGGNFSGPGIEFDSSWYFIPQKAGIGLNNIHYQMVDSSYNNGGSALICSIDTITSINVNALPTARLLAPVSNAYFCSNDTLQRLIPDNSISGLTHSFSSTTGGIATSVTTVFDTVGNTITFYSDTSFYFNPTAVSGGTHIVTQITTDSLGCQDSTRTSFIVNLFQTPDFTIDSTYCASSDSIALYGFPGGGIFTLNGDTLNASGQNAIPYFYPIRRDSTGAVATQTVYDTIVYSISDTACISIKERVVKIYPFPQISFATNSNQNTYCLGGDTVQLIGFGSGTFSGNGVRTATNHFIPDLAGPGFHPIRYYYQDSTTLCDNEFVDTIKVYGTPNLDFTVEGGCQLDSSFFYPNNANLGLDNIFQNNIIDSITSIKWVFTTSDSLIGSSQGNTIDSVGYRYPTSGIYYPTLIVTNQYLCTDTQTIRLVISPTVNSYPYTENFENSAGSWFAESRDSSYSSLWEWGIDTNSVGSIPNSFNHIWMTNKDGGYGPAEDAWVYSPCFDISTLSRPMISLDYWTDTRQQADGTILEYQKANGSWAPVGELDRGINWFNTPFIAGDPGDTTDRIFPIGWSGQSTTWQNGRYKLDDYRGTNNVLRLRMAFASVKNDPQGLYDGFAFDNVVVQNRTRNVLLETMTNVDFVGMETANNHIYQLALNSSLNKDVVLLQYHMENPNPNDIFYNHNPTLGRNRAYEYSAPAGRAFIDGYDPLVTFTTFDLRATDFEYDMLQFPKFSIVIDTFLHVNSTFEIQATVTALENLDSADYRVYTVICEDSLTYPRGSGYGSPLYAVARENDQFHTNTSINTNNIIKTPWVAGQAEPISFIWNHGTSGFINYRPNKFHAIVFIQNIDTKEVYQVATTRAIGGYWVGIDPIQAEKELNELQSLKLFPNPAHDYFNLQFDQALEHDYEWKLVNMQGVEVQQGHIQMGTDQVRIDGLDYPSGAYILLLYNNNVFVQRKVVLGRP